MVYTGHLHQTDTNELQPGIKGVLRRLATPVNVSLIALGSTNLYTVPAGRSALIFDIVPIITAVSVFATPATIRAGVSPTFTQVLAATVLTGLSSVNAFTHLGLASLLPIRTVLTAGQILAADVTVIAGATTLTADMHVIGIEF